MKNRKGGEERGGGGNFRDKRVTFQFRIFRIPEIISSLMKNFFPRVKDLPPPSVSSFSNNPTPDLAPDIISSFGEGEQFASILCLIILRAYNCNYNTVDDNEVFRSFHFVYSSSTKDELCNEELVLYVTRLNSVGLAVKTGWEISG